MRKKLLVTICLLALLGSGGACSGGTTEESAEPPRQSATEHSDVPRDQERSSDAREQSDQSGNGPDSDATGSGSDAAPEDRDTDPSEGGSEGESSDAGAENQPLPEEPPEDVFEPDDADFADAEDQPLEYTTAPEDWWGEDYCHYFIQDGVTHGDVCISQFAADYYLVHRYDPNSPANQGAVLMQYYTAVPPGWVMYRDWTEPALSNSPEIAWIYHPADLSQVTAENFWVVMNDGSSYTVAHLEALIAEAARGGGNGAGAAQPPAGLPVWDPALRPFSQERIDFIRDSQRHTNPGIF